MGRKFSGLLQSAPGFLSMGVMAATLKDEGIVPVIREEFIIWVIKGNKEGKQNLTRCVGIGSNWQVVDLDFWTHSAISFAVCN